MPTRRDTQIPNATGIAPDHPPAEDASSRAEFLNPQTRLLSEAPVSTTTATFTIVCLDCSRTCSGSGIPQSTHTGNKISASRTSANALSSPALLSQCPYCGSQWLEARYDYEALGKVLPAQLAGRPYDLWRYHELLPVQAPIRGATAGIHRLSLGEGWTPLIHAEKLGTLLGYPHIYIKDERQGPTASFKDRQAAVSIAALKEAGIQEAVLASTGNVAISYSAYAARAGIKLWAFLTSLVPAEKMREVALYGTQVIKVTGSYDQAKQLAAEFARQRGLYLEKGARSIPSVEAMKTIAFEICEQLAFNLRDSSNESHSGNDLRPWPAPDWYFQSVSGGLGPLGVSKGFHELHMMNLSRQSGSAQVPAIACIQAEGCAPMVHAWKEDRDRAEPVRSPRTHIATLSTGDPGHTYTLLYQAIRQNGGFFESVTDEESYRAMHILAKLEGISVEPAAAVAVAGLFKMAGTGQVKAQDVIVINCTGHTLPVEPAILRATGRGWADGKTANPLLPLEATPSLERQPTSTGVPEEGLLAALSISAASVSAEQFASSALDPTTCRIVIVDDNADARRLIRRILQSHVNASDYQDETYQFFEAEDGYEAIQLAQRELPDLIILDLMMPEMDGFTVLDALKDDPRTTSIPVIVVTAKELTSQENARLRGRIHSLMQKGEFMNDDLLDEILSAILPAGTGRSG